MADVLTDPSAAAEVAGQCLVVEGLGSPFPAALGTLPAVVVAVNHASGGDSRSRDLSADVAISLNDQSTLEAIEATVATCPRAAVTLALLLRGADARSIDDGLIAESTAYSMLQSGEEFARWRSTRPPKSVIPADSPVLIERERVALTITLNRPDRHNALGVQVRDALCEALSLAIVDDSIETVTLSGNGPSFCSGGDLDEFGSFATLTDPPGAHLVRLSRSPAAFCAALGPRLTAHVHGHCLGGGVELAAFASTVIARPDSVFGLPEVRLGLIPGAGGTVSLPRRIGRLRTAELALTSRQIDAETARSWGLVDAIVD